MHTFTKPCLKAYFTPLSCDTHWLFSRLSGLFLEDCQSSSFLSFYLDVFIYKQHLPIFWSLVQTSLNSNFAYANAYIPALPKCLRHLKFNMQKTEAVIPDSPTLKSLILLQSFLYHNIDYGNTIHLELSQQFWLFHSPCPSVGMHMHVHTVHQVLAVLPPCTWYILLSTPLLWPFPRHLSKSYRNWHLCYYKVEFLLCPIIQFPSQDSNLRYLFIKKILQ